MLASDVSPAFHASQPKTPGPGLLVSAVVPSAAVAIMVAKQSNVPAAAPVTMAIFPVRVRMSKNATRNMADG